MTRRDLVQAISPSRSGRVKSVWNPEELSRPKAEEVVTAVFESIAEALRKGETVSLPFGTFEVLDQPRTPVRGWFLGRVRVTYKQRKYVRIHPARGASRSKGSGGVEKV